MEFRGQSSKVKVTIEIYRNKFVNAIETCPLCAFLSNLADMFAIVRDGAYSFWRSEVKLTWDTYGYKLVNTIETKPLFASSSNLADMLTMVRWWSLSILEFTGQRLRSRWASFTNVRCAGMLRFTLLYYIFTSLFAFLHMFNFWRRTCRQLNLCNQLQIIFSDKIFRFRNNISTHDIAIFFELFFNEIVFVGFFSWYNNSVGEVTIY